jgi:oxaloacetate decarboxylase alpha subunit
MGTAQPATEVMVAALKGTEYDTGLDDNKLKEISDYLKPIREDAIESGLLSPKMLAVDIATLLYQVPGGMLSNLVSQLKNANAEDKYDEVLKEIPRVRADLGFPPLVTPSSQIVGTQAVLNVLMGERYKMVPKETKDIVRGMYGKTPVAISDEIREKIIGDEKPITCRPADLLEPQLKKIEEEMKDYKEKEEDVLSYALFPQQAMDYFKFRQAQKFGIDPNLADVHDGVYPV